ncbi:MAG: hypothetical protein JRD89_08730 [Deltaproteobacteria bacterium]|nr:hypothetical protein [Deltaproteobacteria bacterium]
MVELLADDLRAQSGEDKIVFNYFDGFVGRFLDIGAYDGVACSNTYALTRNGWGGTLVEGGIAAFCALRANHTGEGLQLVHAVMAQAAAVRPLIEWWENAQERPGGYEAGWWAGLGSTTMSAQRDRMLELYGKPENWRRFWVRPLSTGRLIERCPGPYHFITVDTEGSSVPLLCELDLAALQTQVVCIEHNAETDHDLLATFLDYDQAKQHCSSHGLSVELFNNGVNAIFARPLG